MRRIASLLSAVLVAGTAAVVGAPAAAALTAAAKRGDAQLTLELRVPDRHQFDPRYGRNLANAPALQVSYNTPPATPVNLENNRYACETTSPGRYLNPKAVDFTPSVVMRSLITEADEGDELTARYELWPVNDQATKRTFDVPVWSGGWSEVLVRQEELTEGATYAWRVNGSDGTDVSPWTATCYFTVDSIRPNQPAVTSELYRPEIPTGQGEVDRETQFTFSANGSDDVVGYEYTISPGGHVDPKVVAPERPGGSVTVSWAPRDSYHHYFNLTAIDRTGARSETLSYGFYVTETRPWVWSNTYPEGLNPRLEGGVGVPGVFDFTPGLPDVVEYAYRLEDGPVQTVSADAEGKASATVTPVRGGVQTLYVQNRSRGGELSAARKYLFQVDDMPTVTGLEGLVLLGEARTVTFSPRAEGVSSYDYVFDRNGSPGSFRTVQAGPDGKAVLTWTPRVAGYYTVEVSHRYRDGGYKTSSRPYWFVVGEGASSGRS